MLQLPFAICKVGMSASFNLYIYYLVKALPVPRLSLPSFAALFPKGPKGDAEQRSSCGAGREAGIKIIYYFLDIYIGAIIANNNIKLNIKNQKAP